MPGMTSNTPPLRPDEGIAPLPTIEGGFQTVLADPPWRFTNRTGKVAPEHRRLDRYSTMDLEAIKALPVDEVPEIGRASCRESGMGSARCGASQQGDGDGGMER